MLDSILALSWEQLMVAFPPNPLWFSDVPRPAGPRHLAGRHGGRHHCDRCFGAPRRRREDHRFGWGTVWFLVWLVCVLVLDFLGLRHACLV